MPFKRKIFLINKSFQLRFAFYVCSWLIALSFAYPLIISNLFDYFIRYMALDPSGPALSTLESARSDLLWLLVLMQIVLILLTFLISIFMSHKIAGPLYRLDKYFKDVKAGHLGEPVRFRKSDYFQELAADCSTMIEDLRYKFAKGKNGIQVAIPRIENAIKNSSSEVQKDLQVALDALREAQKS